MTFITFVATVMNRPANGFLRRASQLPGVDVSGPPDQL
jgi:hypothetical protein